MPPLETFPNLTLVCVKSFSNFFNKKLCCHNKILNQMENNRQQNPLETPTLRRAAEDDDEVMIMQELEDEQLLLIN
ncbi:8960_t:CDS:2, partial [Funneliformis caledonium]